MFLEHVQRIYNRLNVVPQYNRIAILFWSMIPQLLGDLSIEFSRDPS